MDLLGTLPVFINYLFNFVVRMQIGCVVLITVFTVYLFFFLMIRRPPRSTLFPTRRSSDPAHAQVDAGVLVEAEESAQRAGSRHDVHGAGIRADAVAGLRGQPGGTDRGQEGQEQQ